MNTRLVLSRAFLVWFFASSAVVLVALGWGMEGEAWWKYVVVFVAYASLVWGAACWFCKQANAVLGSQNQSR